MSSPFSEEEKKANLYQKYYPQNRKLYPGEIQSYTKIEKEGTEAYIKAVLMK